MEDEYKRLINTAKSKKKETNKFFKKLERHPPKNLDALFHKQHEKVFQEIDCLSCANCCKTTSPIFTNKDIERMAAHFKIKVVEFYDKYLQTDEEGDQVLQSSPCPFLGEDNKCKVYDIRPKACREYPHTNRKRMHQILDLTATNSRICPAVAKIVEKIKQEF